MPKQWFQADGLFSLTFLCIMLTYLPALVRSIEVQPNDKRSDQTNEFIWWLIKPNSLKKVRDAFSCWTFSLFPRSCQDVATDQMVTDRIKDQRSLADDLASWTHWRMFVTHPDTESFQYGNKIRVDRESLRNDNLQIEISRNSCLLL